MRKLISFLLLSFVVYALQAQIKDPVKFKTELNTLSDTEAEIVFTATIDQGWHVYSTELGDGDLFLRHSTLIRKWAETCRETETGRQGGSDFRQTV